MSQTPQQSMAERRRRTAYARQTTASTQSQTTKPPDDDDEQPRTQSTPPPNTPPHQGTQRQRVHEKFSPPDQQQPLHNGTATQLGGGAVEWKAFGQTVYVRDATKHPPMASFIIAVLIGIPCVGAIFGQMITTFSAFSNMVFDGKVWEHFSRAAQDGGRPIVNVACILIAISFQAPLIFWAFKVDKRFASERHVRLSFMAKLGKVVDVTKEVVAANLLLSIWAFIAIIADTIGDVSFVAMFTDSQIFLFFYSTGLYSLSTIGLSECLQMVWDGMVTSEWLRHVKAANDLAAHVVANAASKPRGARA